jgi:hypothetical protein
MPRVIKKLDVSRTKRIIEWLWVLEGQSILNVAQIPIAASRHGSPRLPWHSHSARGMRDPNLEGSPSASCASLNSVTTRISQK